MNQEEARGPLHGLRVLDLTHYIAGPYCTKLLADLGADVIKVERPGTGDGARRMGPFVGDDPHAEKSIPFLYLNTGKRSLTLNLKTATGRGILLRLAGWADVFIENFAPRVMPSLGLDYTTISGRYPELVYTSISNYGQNGPYRDYRGAELTAYASGGLMYVTGAYEREPLRHGGDQAQYWAGEMAALATLTASYARRQQGVGQHVDVSLMETMVAGLQHEIITYSYMGAVARRWPHADSAFDDNQPCADGYITPVLRGGDELQVLAERWSTPALADPVFRSRAGRAQHAPEFLRTLRQAIAEKGKAELFHEAQSLRAAFGMVQTAADLANCPQLAARSFFTPVTHPVAGTAPYPGVPAKLSATPGAVHRPAPLLGEHNEEVLSGLLGFTRQELVQLRERGII